MSRWVEGLESLVADDFAVVEDMAGVARGLLADPDGGLAVLLG